MMRKTETAFFTIADYEDEEKWLREMHMDGWKLVKMVPPCFYTFEECEPEDVIYRLDFRSREEEEEYMNMLEDFGWEYFAECFGWLYFRKPASEIDTEEEGELFSDNASRVKMISDVIRTRLVPLMLIFLVCVVPNMFRAFVGGMGAIDVFLAVFFSVLFVLYVYLIVHCSVKLKMIREKYEDIG